MAACVAIMLLAQALRIVDLGASDLWLDEAISVFIASKSPADIVRYTASSVSEHPPGYYLILHGWLRLAGTSEFALRFLSAIGGMLFLASTATLVRRWFGDRTAALTALVIALQPIAVQYGRDGRMYAWLMLATVLMVAALDRALTLDRRRDWVLFGAASLVALSIHYLAGLVLVALALFIAVRWTRLPPARLRAALVLSILLGAPLIWILLNPGPRGSLLGLLTNSNLSAWTPGRMLPIVGHWALASTSDPLPDWQAALLGLPIWVLVGVGIVRMQQPANWPRAHLQALFALVLLVPPIAGSFVFPFMVPRHFSSAFGFFVISMALGLVYLLRRCHRALAIAVLLLVLGTNLALSLSEAENTWRPISPAMTYIQERARDGEPTVYTYFFDWPIDAYYDRRNLDQAYLPAGDEDISPEAAETHAGQLLQEHGSLWLMLYPGRSSTDTVDAAFARLGYGALKEWFPGDRAVAHYFGDLPLRPAPADATWGDFLRLTGWAASHMTGDRDAGGAPLLSAPAGEALRLQFDWDASAANGQRLLFAVALLGDDGAVWAQRRGEPCNWRCPTDTWDGGSVTDRLAFVVPADLPPGDYAMQASWLTTDGESVLAWSGGRLATAIRLGTVRVGPPATDALRAAPLASGSRPAAAAGGLTLVSLAPPVAPVLAGSPLSLPVQWQVEAPQPALEARLQLVRNGQQWTQIQPLGPTWHPSDRWTAGRLVRAQPQFRLSGLLAPGEYAASLVIARMGAGEDMLTVPVGRLVIRDRERRFELPEIGVPVAASWVEGIKLVQLASPVAAQPGETIEVTLVWRADRPTAGNWKVFIHLVDAEGTTRAQGDGYPLGGTALTTTWQSGEVIVDTYPISLAADLQPGTYRLQIGFYDEETDERLPLSPGVDTWTWPAPVTIGAQ